MADGSQLGFYCLVRVICGSSRSFFATLILATQLASGCRTVPGKPDAFVELVHVVPGLVLDIRYATTNNFTGQKVYSDARCFLRSGPAGKLKRVQKELASQGLGLKIFDGFRPLAVQRRFWEIMPDERYVANPAKGSRHNRGAAVDLTLIRLSDGRELPMPMAFDDFSERAGRDYPDLPAEVIRNRDLLRGSWRNTASSLSRRSGGTSTMWIGGTTRSRTCPGRPRMEPE